jgi:hypothetical protein
MARFDPAPRETISLEVGRQARSFRAMVHPAAPTFVHAMEGGKAHVYRIQDTSTGAECALKVMKPRFRESSLVERCEALDALKALPGMAVCERRCFTAHTAPATLAQYRDLEYAILMPWIEGQTWFDIVAAGLGGSAISDRDAALSTASSFVQVLAALEEHGVAHCDLSAGNVVVETTRSEVALVDVEDVYKPELSPPGSVPAGTPGYQHRTSPAGMWRPDADRFAGAILLAEMLAWFDPDVRAAAAGESYFEPDELQKPGTARLGTLIRALREHRNGSALVGLLERAWTSDTLDACPPLSEWNRALALARLGVTFGPPITPAEPRRGHVFWTAIKPAEPERPRVQWNRSSATPPPATPVP